MPLLFAFDDPVAAAVDNDEAAVVEVQARRAGRLADLRSGLKLDRYRASGVPEPCAVSVEADRAAQTNHLPGAIGFPAPQFEAVLKNVAGFAFAQLLPLPEPVACLRDVDIPEQVPAEQAAVGALIVAMPDTLPAASTAATPSV